MAVGGGHIESTRALRVPKAIVGRISQEENRGKMSEEIVMKEASTTPVEDMSLLSITDGENARGIPFLKFIDDVDSFANSFTPPASAELIIGAYSELHSKFKTFETTLTQKSEYGWRKYGAILHVIIR